MTARRRHRNPKVVYLSCPECKKKYAGTIDYQKIASFPNGKGLEEHRFKEHKIKGGKK